MQILANEVNRNYFRTIPEKVAFSSRIDIAVAYITDETVFKEALRRDIVVNVWTLVNENTNIRTIELLKKYSQYKKINIHITEDFFHPKVILFHGCGYYLGSANLSDRALNKNIELGIFVENETSTYEESINDIKSFFYSLSDYTTPVNFQTLSRIYDALKVIDNGVRGIQKELRERKYALGEDWRTLKKQLFSNKRTPNIQSSKDSIAKHRFINEWKETIGLINSIVQQYSQYKTRPSWLPQNTHSVIEVDRMLSWYYDTHIKDRTEGNVYDIIERLHLKNKGHEVQSLKQVFISWAELTEEPEEGLIHFVNDASNLLIEYLSESKIRNLSIDEIAYVVENCHALMGHIDKFISYDELGIRRDGSRASLKLKALGFVKSKLLIPNKHGLTFLDTLHYFLWDDDELEFKLWNCLDKNSKYYIPGVGRSSYGELIGRARPDDFPVRNDRISRTLYALGCEVDFA